VDLSEVEQKMAVGDWSAAADVSRDMLRSQPVNARLHGYLGWSLMQLGEFAPAVESLKRAHNLDPKSLASAKCLAQCLVKVNRFQEAWDVLQDAIKLDPNDRALKLLHDFLISKVKLRGERWEINQNVEARVVMADDEG
jgi:cytochrome c-type biogenesis protein CcmH/NrfG